jgi:S1-C subfamily serine protease
VVSVAGADGELTRREATLLGRDPGLDLAVLRVAGPLVAPSWRDPATVSVGTLAVAIGRPGRTARASLRMVGVRADKVHTPGGGVLEAYLETDRQIPRGFAGGPIIDVAGRVLGMSTRTLLRGADLAITAVDVERSVALIAAHGAVPRGYLGVGVTAVALGRALRDELGRTHAALVSAVDEGGPAEAAGVLQGDLLLAVDGRPLAGPIELRELVAQRPGAQVALELVRGGKVVSLRATLGTRP